MTVSLLSDNKQRMTSWKQLLLEMSMKHKHWW